MQHSRDNLTRRQSAPANTPDYVSSLERKLSTTDSSSDRQEHSQVKAMNARAVIFPNHNPEVYNADGSLRTMYQMPLFDSRWKEAQQARYIRTRELLERDRELSVKDIFDKK